MCLRACVCVCGYLYIDTTITLLAVMSCDYDFNKRSSTSGFPLVFCHHATVMTNLSINFESLCNSSTLIN